MYTLLVIDDNKNDLNILNKALTNLLLKEDISFRIDCYDNIHNVDYDKDYDVVFLDIDMPEKSGFELAKHFQQSFLIFITNRDDLVFDSFEYHPFAFIRKFLLDSELKVTMKRLIPELFKVNQYITVHSFGQKINLKVSDIIYIESYIHNCTIHMIDHTLTIRMKLSEFQEIIHHNYFYSIHQSYLVNWNYVKKINKYECILTNKETIPISQRKYKDTLNAYHQFILRRL